MVILVHQVHKETQAYLAQLVHKVIEDHKDLQDLLVAEVLLDQQVLEETWGHKVNQDSLEHLEIQVHLELMDNKVLRDQLALLETKEHRDQQGHRDLKDKVELLDLKVEQIIASQAKGILLLLLLQR